MQGLNPVFIPGPTNIPERLRHAMNAPTLDHRAPSFGAMLPPLMDGVRGVLKSRDAAVILLSTCASASA